MGMKGSMDSTRSAFQCQLTWLHSQAAAAAAAAERCLYNQVSACEKKKSQSWPRHWSAVETAALTHSQDPQATVWAALSVKKALFTESKLSQQPGRAAVV